MATTKKAPAGRSRTGTPTTPIGTFVRRIRVRKPMKIVRHKTPKAPPAPRKRPSPQRHTAPKGSGK